MFSSWGGDEGEKERRGNNFYGGKIRVECYSGILIKVSFMVSSLLPKQEARFCVWGYNILR